MIWSGHCCRITVHENMVLLQMKLLPDDDQSVGTALSLGQSIGRDVADQGSVCNLYMASDTKSVSRQSALYQVSDDIVVVF